MWDHLMVSDMCQHDTKILAVKSKMKYVNKITGCTNCSVYNTHNIVTAYTIYIK